MSFRSKIVKLIQVLRYPYLLLSRGKYIFVIGHMRSRSTVMAHVLGSHPEIEGYIERHRPYRSKMDFLRWKLESEGKTIKGKYLLDKILHQYAITDKVLRFTHLKVIFLVREPEAALKSIIQLSQRSQRVSMDTPKKALEYYRQQLDMMKIVAGHLNHNYQVVKSEDLIAQTTNTLNAITRYLGLKTPLTNTYSIFEHTGTAARGDSSPHIMEGTIQDIDSNHDAVLPVAIISKARLEYEACLSFLNGESCG